MTTFQTLPADIPPVADGQLPGDADAIADLARRFSGEAETLQSGSHDLGASDTSVQWQGRAGHACQSAVNRAAARLDQLAGSYDDCAAALSQWAESLRAAQEDARRASDDLDDARERLQEAEEALERLGPDDLTLGGGAEPMASAVQTMPDDVRAPSEDVRSLPAEMPPIDGGGAREEWQQKADEARADLEAARGRLDDAVNARDDAAAVAANKIQETEPGPEVVAMGAA